jgi:hypothetical protein
VYISREYPAHSSREFIPSEIRATVKLYFDGKIRQWIPEAMGRASL